MTNLDESSIIKIFQSKLGSSKFVSEDVEIFKLGSIEFAAKTETMVESTDIPPEMSLSDAARKSIVACVSDFAAKGINPQYGIISVNLPRIISSSKIVDIAKGFRKACDEYGISILGGDTNEGKEIVFNVCIFGKTQRLVRRSGSKRGDIIFVTGPFGYTAAGLNMLLCKKKTKGSFARKCINSVVKPKPRLGFGLKNKRYFSSSMDSSDGLSTTLNEMARQSKKKFVIDNIPCAKDLKHFAKSQKFDLDSMVFNGGEEYEFAFTVSAKNRNTVKKNARLHGIPVIEIGYVTLGKGVFLQEDDKHVRLKDSGWKHFK